MSNGRRCRVSRRMLGHVAREACRMLCPLLSASTLRVTSYVVSDPYSRDPEDYNWGHRVLDIHVFVSGPQRYLPFVHSVLDGKDADLPGLTFGPFDGCGNTKISEEELYSESPPSTAVSTSSSGVGRSADTDDSSLQVSPSLTSSFEPEIDSRMTRNNETTSETQLTPPALSSPQISSIHVSAHLPQVPSVNSHIDEIVEWALFPPAELIPPTIGSNVEDIVNWVLFPPTELMMPPSQTSISYWSSISSSGTLDAIDFLFSPDLP